MKCTKKQIIHTIVGLILAISSITIATPIQNLQAAGKKAEAINAYKSFLNQNKISVGDRGKCKLKKDIQFGIEDLNHDGVPELILNTESEFGESCIDVVYTYYNEEVSFVTYSNYGNVISYKRGSIFETDHVNRGNGYIAVYNIEDGTGEEIAHITDDTNDLGIEGVVYYIGEKRVSRKKYHKYIKKLTKNSKYSNIEMYSLTKHNINQYLK